HAEPAGGDALSAATVFPESAAYGGEPLSDPSILDVPPPAHHRGRYAESEKTVLAGELECFVRDRPRARPVAQDGAYLRGEICRMGAKVRNPVLRSAGECFIDHSPRLLQQPEMGTGRCHNGTAGDAEDRRQALGIDQAPDVLAVATSGLDLAEA